MLSLKTDTGLHEYEYDTGEMGRPMVDGSMESRYNQHVTKNTLIYTFLIVNKNVSLTLKND